MDNIDSSDGFDYQLTDADKAALDEIFGSEDGSAFKSNEPSHESQVHKLLGLLDCPISRESDRGTLIDVTVLRAHTLTSDSSLECASTTSVDDWMDGQSLLTERDEIHNGIAGLVTTGAEYTDAERNSLVERTLGMVESETRRSEKRYIMDMPISPRGRFRLADLVSLAATILLLASVAIPVMGGMKSRSMQSLCLDNMATAGQAFGLYAGSNRDTLPMATAGFGSTWMDVGTTPERSNSSNLYMLVRTNHATLADLACPTNPDALVEESGSGRQDWRSIDEISYSYRIMGPGGLKTYEVDQPVGVVLLSDRSPVTLRISRKQPVRPEENTPNHDHMGQHVLGLDGASRWVRSPVLEDGDNIWLPRPIEEAIYQIRDRLGIIQGNELPSGPSDAFVGP
ncbi:MAG: hypothetical protein AB8C13_05455 [Phycisphaerales bacterium]